MKKWLLGLTSLFGLCLVATQAQASCDPLLASIKRGFLVTEIVCDGTTQILAKSALDATTDYAGLVIEGGSLDVSATPVFDGGTVIRFRVRAALTGYSEAPINNGGIKIATDEPLMAKIIDVGIEGGHTLTQAWCTLPRDSLKGGHACIMAKVLQVKKNLYTTNNLFVLTTLSNENMLTDTGGYSKAFSWGGSFHPVIVIAPTDKFTSEARIVFTKKSNGHYELSVILPEGALGKEAILPDLSNDFLPVQTKKIVDGDLLHMSFGDYKVRIVDEQLSLEPVSAPEDYNGSFIRFVRLSATYN